MTKTIRVSLVLPAYNEEDYLRACLEAIERQTVKPYEVIVVDNNSSDETAVIARSFPFVKLITERKQGVIYARARGFNAARGDVIGRIDVDTILPETWVASIQQIFADSEVDAVSGVAKYYDVAWAPAVNAVDLFFRRHLAKKLEKTDTVFLQGANMAIRRNAWQSVRDILCEDRQMHEDFDIAIHLQELGYKVRFDDCLVAGLSARRTDVPYLNFVRYARANPRTYGMHGLASRRHMYPVVALAMFGYIAVRPLYRGYNPETERFEFSRLFTPSENRISPVAAQE